MENNSHTTHCYTPSKGWFRMKYENRFFERFMIAFEISIIYNVYTSPKNVWEINLNSRYFLNTDTGVVCLPIFITVKYIIMVWGNNPCSLTSDKQKFRGSMILRHFSKPVSGVGTVKNIKSPEINVNSHKTLVLYIVILILEQYLKY